MHTSRQVAALLRLPVSQVRAYARAGFITPSRGPRRAYQFHFQDLIVLRTAVGLKSPAISHRRLQRTFRKLRAELPDGRSLTELRFEAQDRGIVVCDGTVTWEVDSEQFNLHLGTVEADALVAPLPDVGEGIDRSFRARQADAAAWYDAACELDHTDPRRAKRAYRKALDANPAHVEARINLGRLLDEDGEPEAAAEHFRIVLELDPENATASFNLGVALENLDRFDEAIAAYEGAIAYDPAIADARFNLASLCERLGRDTDAFRHLKAYRALLKGTAPRR